MKEMIKNNRVIFFIVCFIVVVLVGVVVYFTFFNKEEKILDKDSDKTSEVIGNDDEKEEVNVPNAPATNTEDLVKSMESAEIVSVDEDTITFEEKVEVSEGEKVAVWIYSEPKFLGYFEVIVKNGVKMIEGLATALSNITIDSGSHNIAIVTESGKDIGYIDVYIEEDGKLEEKKEDKEEEKKPSLNVEDKKDEVKEEKVETPVEQEKEEIKKPVITSKEVVVNEDITYTTTTQNEVNMFRGAKEVIQSGVNGTKAITYKVTYEDGKEVSREKISENITKEVVNEIVKVGTSDFNINTDSIQGSMSGEVCTKDDTYTYDGIEYCNEEESGNSGEFSAIKINGTYYITKFRGNSITALKTTTVRNNFVSATYNGTAYYFDGRMGDGEPITLTKEVCEKYNLSCGAW